MKLIKSVLAISALLYVSITHADNHGLNEGADSNAPFNIQVQLCSLLDGVTQKQYDAFLDDYFVWSKNMMSKLRLLGKIRCLRTPTLTNLILTISLNSLRLIISLLDEGGING